MTTDQPTATADPEPAPDAAEGFFRDDGGRLVPAPFATSPWGEVLHGRLIGGLTARAAQSVFAGDPGMFCTRLTIDMFRSARLAPVQVSIRPVRSGRRIAVIEVTVEQDDGPVGQGLAVLLRQSRQPEGTFRPVPAWDGPAPPALGPPPAGAPRRWQAPWESWRVPGPDADGAPLGGGVWIRDIHPLVTGEPLTPLARLAMAADLASPVGNSSTGGLGFINADYTVYVGREPRGEHIGIQPYGHLSQQGVAVAQCIAHDRDGPVGFVATAAVANAMRR